MRLGRLHCARHASLAAVLAVALIAGQALASAAAAGAAPAGVPDSSAASPAAYLLYQPTFLHNFSNYQSALYVQNLGSMDATVDLTFYSATAGPISLPATIQVGATLAYEPGQVPGLPNGSYWLAIASDQPVASVVEIYRLNGERLAAYRGMTEPAAPASGPYLLVFSPFLDSGGLTLWNIAAQATVITVDLVRQDGSIATSLVRVVAANATLSLYGPGLQIPPGVYTAVVSADGPLVGLLNLQLVGQPPLAFEVQPPAAAPAMAVGFARVQKQMDEGVGLRSSQLFLTNRGDTGGTFTVSFYDANGNAVYARGQSVAAGGTAVLDLASFNDMPAGIFGVMASGNQPLSLSGLTAYAAPPPRDPVATYGERSEAVEQSLPRLVKTAAAYTIFSVQNPNAQLAQVSIVYRDLAGSPIANQTVTLPARGWQRYDLRQMPALPDGFTGSAVISSDQPVGVLADDFYVPCEPPGSGQISRVPAGDLFPGVPVQFTASASGTQPFSYAWTVDGQPAGSDSATLDQSFPTADRYTVGVTITNACGQTTASLEVDVLDPPRPDLSTSSKSASQSAVDAGDTVTYTLILRNTGPVAASAVITDPIPAHTAYVAGSAQASDLSPVTLANGALHWAGQVVSGTVVTIRYAVQIQPAPIGTSIENVASLSDGQGHVATLQAAAIFNPGYRLTIDDGALYTSVPTVMLRFAWNAAAGVTTYQVSNDGGFTPGSGTSAWLPVDRANPIHPGWELATYGDLRLPRTVYIRFRDAGGTPFGPFQDDIILDPVPPQVVSFELAPMTSGGSLLRPAWGKSVLVKVTAHDDNSGVQAVQLSHRSDFANASSYPVAAGLTEIVWLLQPSGLVYGRVLDGAGNPSPAVSAQGDPWYPVYVPMLQRGAQ
jgi:uncharacterized repeat protein (TIGR01451 family)